MGPFTGSARHAIDRSAPGVLAILHDNLNKLVRAAERARGAEKYALEAEIRDIINRAGLRYVELAIGRKMSVNLNLRSQDDLVDYRNLPPEARATLDAALDLMEAYGKGGVVPAKALSSAKVGT